MGLIVKDNGDFNWFGIGFILCILGVLAFIGFQVEYGSEHSVTFKVASLDDQSTYSGHKYLVFTTDGDVYENVDDGWYFKYDSSDIYAFLLTHKGTTVTCNVNGYRNHLSSNYPNIISCTTAS